MNNLRQYIVVLWDLSRQEERCETINTYSAEDALTQVRVELVDKVRNGEDKPIYEITKIIAVGN